MQLPLPFGEGVSTGTRASLLPDLATDLGRPCENVQPSFDHRSLVFVRHRRARRYILRLDREGRARVTIPRGGSRREATAFAERHQQWIARERARMMRREVQGPADPDVLTRAQAVLSARLLDLAARHRLTVTRLSVRNQRTRWGSCGRDGHICLNWRLMLMPEWVSEYVLIHELMHLKRMDHSPAYWKLVSTACPDYRAARQWLRANGPALR